MNFDWTLLGMHGAEVGPDDGRLRTCVHIILTGIAKPSAGMLRNISRGYNELV